MEYKRAIHVKNLYQELKKDGIGTTKIETMSKKLCDTLPRHRQRTLVKVITNWKLQDAHKQLHEQKHTNTRMWRQEKDTIAAAGLLDAYERLWRREITRFENGSAETQKKKLQHLRNRYKRTTRTIVPDEMEGIILKDQEIPNNFASTPRTYGGVVLDENEQSVLTLPPKFAMFEKINEETCEAEIEKMLAKLRWEEKKKQIDPEGNELPPNEKRWHDHRTKTMDMREYRSTYLPFNSRIYAPQPLDHETETCMQNLKMKLNQCTQRYVENERRRKDETNLTAEQRSGLASLKSKEKKKEVVIFETDKSKRFSCDTINNYQTMGAVHTVDDEVVTMEDVKAYEKEVNAHGEMWLRILSAGTETRNYDRIRSSMKSRNNPPAPLSIVRKDHKPYDNEVIGPPGRPICGGDVSYNKRLSHLISTLLTDVYKGEETVCSSTEELLAEVERVNNEGIDEMDMIGSMDVEALYPKLHIDFTIEKVCDELHDSSVNFEGLNYKELGLYLSLVRSEEQLQEMGLHTVCPSRRHRRGPRPKITGCGMQENDEERHAPWIFPDISTIDNQTKRKMQDSPQLYTNDYRLP